MRDYQELEPCLWKWTCTDCLMEIRTRHSHSTKAQARHHAYEEHRRQLPLVVPIACLWDSRIQGKAVLVTYADW